ncbi:MAG: hypothetical protein AAFO99_14655 [Bacteroidota bacterium]
MDLKSLKDIPSSFDLAKKAMVISMVVCLLISTGSLAWAFYITKNFAKTAYIITDNGQLALASGITPEKMDAYRNPEIKNHIATFHRLFWNFDQFSMEGNINRALHLTGNSGKELYLSLKAKGHFQKIRSQNLIQSLLVDSIKVNQNTIPVTGALYGKLKVKRTDQKNERTEFFSALFELQDVARTDENPHGLLIENYDVKINAIIED